MFWNTWKTFYSKFHCLYSKIGIKLDLTNPAAQSGYCYLLPVKAEDLDLWTVDSVVPAVEYPTIKQNMYVKYKNYIAGYGSPKSIKFSHRMSKTKLYGRKYDPTVDIQPITDTSGNEDTTWYWYMMWISETAGTQIAAIDVTITYYVTMSDRINVYTYDN